MEFVVRIAWNVARESVRDSNRAATPARQSRRIGAFSFRSICEGTAETDAFAGVAILVHRSRHKTSYRAVVAARIPWTLRANPGTDCRRQNHRVRVAANFPSAAISDAFRRSIKQFPQLEEETSGVRRARICANNA